MRLGQQADLVVVAPATADLLGPGRARPGRRPADQHAAHRPLPGGARPRDAHRDVGAPGHPRQRRDAARARRRTSSSPPPAGSPAPTPAPAGCPSPRRSTPRAARLLAGCRAGRGAAARRDLAGRRVVVSAGGTREPLDPVRYLGNRSSGKQGYALAAVAAARGADVTLVAANTVAAGPGGRATSCPSSTVAGAAGAPCTAAATDADVVVMAAAPADFRPGALRRAKIKKTARPGPGRRARRSSWCATPTSSPGWWRRGRAGRAR